MSLPPGFIDELRTRTSLSQVVGRKVMWDARKSNQGKGDMWAPCPFHQEKSASFHVDDRKGFYYCFGCHAKGDAISFVRETENVGFMEAIEILARESGMQMPAPDPQAQQKADKRSQLAEVMEQAVQYYRLQLKTSAAADARDYLDRRGLNEAAQARYDIGFAAEIRQGVFQHLTGKGVDPELIIDAGLAAKPDDGGAPYDRFRGRIIFPIRDARGRAIALGGRSLDPNARAKYLNSPETALFDKGRSLYNHGPAREAAGKGQPLIVAEGYMDVIALSEAGFGATVAPLGTAITEDQLRLMWRISPEPIIALDGDNAGLRAAMRLIDIALPMLEVGLSLRFALMPEGQDPDDILRAQGPGAMQKLLDQAQPMVQLLWQRETEGKIFDSPERKAALDKSLRDAIRKIQDPSIRNHYGEAIKQMRWDLFGTQRRKTAFKKGDWNKRQIATPSPSTKNSLLAAGNQVEEHLREAVVLATLLLHPSIIGQFETALERLELSNPDHNALRNALLSHLGAPAENFRENIAEDAGREALENLFNARHVKLAPTVRNPGDVEIAVHCIAEELAKLDAQRGIRREISEAMQDLTGLADEGLTWRIGQAAEARNRAERAETEDKAEYETAPNGLSMNKDELKRRDDIFSTITFSKKKDRQN
ncbi:DNA primase [Pseudohalocynthiibacter sp. F2068]|jgi:DNA primase|uniref:DNA primase n=1 Tax=Pseudohalocynthiibacter sp. F2068 TaxID=2926418 RepID=UPI001FF10D05|nr:DNA primase [Pseudohalocynthiibacter sp. F2068]MCK0102961.1 DNA primase [Pseudohalocynthiibacter sp. F2068]